jgi:hypothetical protein
MKQFGAVAALLLIHGQTPQPLSPAVILLIIYNFDLHCLTPGFIGEWFVNLQKVLLDWLEIGPEGDPEPFACHFATYHNAQVCSCSCSSAADLISALVAISLLEQRLSDAPVDCC